ncbi:TIGR02584 family CRISPR-associated protein [Lysobacteraceae bacterium NML95-0200]|nr:TIGR02584 family CRISPR-associated protein [Xanthomonadaceae bacterium NML95-0200]
MQTQEQLQPHQYAKRILVVVSGMSPQILTETLYALTQRQQPAFVPTEVHLVSTTSGACRARLALLKDDAQFYCLCNDYGLDPAIFTAANIHTIRDALGNPLDDIRTPADNEAAADFITGFIRKQTANPESAVHVSMAGGRKTMGYYAGYGLSLYGRPQDRLSHVLVSEGFEGHPEFYYPTPASKTIYRGEGKPALDAREAEVDLAEIPFVRMREELPEKVLEANPLLSGKHGFADTVRAAEEARQPQHIVLDMENMQFTCNDKPLRLPAVSLLFLCWLAHRQKTGEEQLSYGKQKEDFEKERQSFEEFCKKFERLDQYIASRRNENQKSWLGDIDRTKKALKSKSFDRNDIQIRKNRLEKDMARLLGKQVAEKMAPKNIGKYGEASLSIVDFEENYTVIPLQD